MRKYNAERENINNYKMVCSKNNFSYDILAKFASETKLNYDDLFIKKQYEEDDTVIIEFFIEESENWKKMISQHFQTLSNLLEND